MKRTTWIRALQIGEIIVMLSILLVIYQQTGKLWIALAAWLLALLSVFYGGMTAILEAKPENWRTATVKLTSADVKQMLTLRLKIARTIAPRLWLCAQVMKVAAAIGGVGIVIDVVNENDTTSIGA